MAEYLGVDAVPTTAGKAAPLAAEANRGRRSRPGDAVVHEADVEVEVLRHRAEHLASDLAQGVDQRAGLRSGG